MIALVTWQQRPNLPFGQDASESGGLGVHVEDIEHKRIRGGVADCVEEREEARELGNSSKNFGGGNSSKKGPAEVDKSRVMCLTKSPPLGGYGQTPGIIIIHTSGGVLASFRASCTPSTKI